VLRTPAGDIQPARSRYLYFTPGKTGGSWGEELSEETFVRRWCDLKQIEGGHFLEMWIFLVTFWSKI